MLKLGTALGWARGLRDEKGKMGDDGLSVPAEGLRVCVVVISRRRNISDRPQNTESSLHDLSVQIGGLRMRSHYSIVGCAATT